jgi:hypothetical protein
MTIEIRQLVIRAVVQPDQAPRSSTWTDSASGRPLSSPQAADDSVSREAILDGLVATCVRTVLRRLERSRDR